MRPYPSAHFLEGATEAMFDLPARAAVPDLASVHRVHADFVWRTLQRFGVREADLDDALQDVFIVVHRRLPEFEGRSRLTTWLYAICQRVALERRRQTQARREDIAAEVPEVADPTAGAPDPERAAQQQEARRRLDAILDELDPERRAAFVMFELEGMSCEEIAEISGVPLGTVYSRLHHARKAFDRAVARWQARDGEAVGRGGR